MILWPICFFFNMFFFFPLCITGGWPLNGGSFTTFYGGMDKPSNLFGQEQKGPGFSCFWYGFMSILPPEIQAAGNTSLHNTEKYLQYDRVTIKWGFVVLMFNVITNLSWSTTFWVIIGFIFSLSSSLWIIKKGQYTVCVCMHRID